jgi:SAM-dependent methyltransferase
MRQCPICNHNGKRVILNDYMTNEEVPNRCLFECTRCEHRYLDGIGHTQAWYDEYYSTRYKTDDLPFSNERLESLADLIDDFGCLYALDIGGMDLELQHRLAARGVVCDVAGIEHIEKSNAYGVVILSHTLEHIYDVPAMMARVKKALYPGGVVVIEVPIHLQYDEPTEHNYHKPYDYKFQHVQKFRPQDLELLLTRNGFTIEVSQQLPDYREYNVWRIVGRYAAG